MHKNLHWICCLLFLGPPLKAQNLVPNPGFEEYGLVPYSWDQLSFAVPWRNPTYATPDYMHEDCVDGSVYRAKIPDNAWGWQFARTGKGYIALHTWVEFNMEIEYAQVDLIDTLEVGVEYRASAWLNRGDFSFKSTNCHGFLFTEDAFTGYNFIERSAQVQNLEILRDTQGWTEISGTFIADKPYRVLTVGNFCGASPPYQSMDEWGWNMTATYYWDDLSVEPTGRQVDFSVEITGACLPALVQLQAQQFYPTDNWLWKWSDGVVQQGQNIGRTFAQPGEYRVTLTHTVNGQTYTIEKKVKVDLPQPPVAAFDIGKDQPSMNEAIRFNNNSQHAGLWLWDFGDGFTTAEKSPEHTYPENGDYRITLIASNDAGCSDTLSLDIYVVCAGKITANTFTPNGDGSNETFPFDSVAVCGAPVSIRIFNRWGNLIYESDDPYRPWRAEGVENGTYFYLVRYKGGEEGGYIEVLR